MNITLEITASPALLAVLQALANLVSGSQATAQSPAASQVQSAVTVEAKEEPAVQEVVSKETKIPSVNGKTITAITIEQIRALVKKKADEGKRDQIKATLAEFGADKVTSLQQDQYTDFHTKLEAL